MQVKKNGEYHNHILSHGSVKYRDSLVAIYSLYMFRDFNGLYLSSDDSTSNENDRFREVYRSAPLRYGSKEFLVKLLIF